MKDDHAVRLDIFQMLVGAPVRLRYVHRFSSCRVGARETVAEHSFYTALYSLVIGEWVVANTDKPVDFGVLLRKAILHDCEEAVTGDINRIFKHFSNELAEAINTAAFKAFDKTWARVLNKDARNHLRRWWVYSKEEGNEGDIVAFADYLSVLSYVVSEIRSSNWTMREHTHGRVGMDQYHKIFLHERFAYLRPLVDQAGEILEKWVIKFQPKEV